MKTVQTILRWVLVTLLCFLPLLFIPTIEDYYDTGKWFVLMGATVLVLVLCAVALFRKSIASHVSLSTSALGFGMLTLASTISLLSVSSNKIEALLSPFGPLSFLALTLLLIVLPTAYNEHEKEKIQWMLFGSTSLVAILVIYQFFGVGKLFSGTNNFLANPLFTPTGHTLASISLFLILIPLLIDSIKQAIKNKNELTTAVTIVMTLTVAVALGVSIYQLVPIISTTLLPLSYAWSIFLEVMKHPKHIISGIGIENFLLAFNGGKSTSYNVSPLWNIRFTESSSAVLHTGTTIGLLGLAGYTALFKTMLKKQRSIALRTSLSIAVILCFVTPGNLTLFSLITVLLILSDYRHTTVSLSAIENRWMRSAIGVLLCFVSLGGGYGAYRMYSAETAFYQSLKSAQANNGTQTYNLQMRALVQNPYISRYHIIYSQTNLALASSLATAIGESNTKVGDATAEAAKTKDRQLVAQLIQQAIREAKFATSLSPTSVLAWENLARIYNQLMGIAQGSDAWAEASYRQAITLDPTNPILRLELGSIAMKKNKYTDAISQFQKSISLKPNYANAYYNLAFAYKASGDIKNAIAAFTQTEQLVGKTSADHDTVINELEKLKNPQTETSPMPTPPPNPSLLKTP